MRSLAAWAVGLALAACLACGAGSRAGVKPSAAAPPAPPQAAAWQLLAANATHWRSWDSPYDIFFGGRRVTASARPQHSATSRGGSLESRLFAHAASACVANQIDETRLSPELAATIAAKYATFAQIAQALPSGIDLGRGAVAVKFAWCLLSDLDDRNPADAITTRDIGAYGQPYALVGISVMAKDQPAPPYWRGVTFVQASIGNLPEDPYQASPAWQALMTQSGFPPASNPWIHYRLEGAQTGYEQPRLLGNAILDGGIATPSCLACHYPAAATATGVVPLPDKATFSPTGPQPPLPAGLGSVDFLWSFACLTFGNKNLPPCLPPENAAAARRSTPAQVP